MADRIPGPYLLVHPSDNFNGDPIHIDIDGFDEKITDVNDIGDIVKLRLLRDYGGVFIDYNRKCPSMGLDKWLFKNMQAGFFAFTKQGDPINYTDLYNLHTFIMASRKKSLIACAWYDELTKYWNTRDSNEFGEDLLSKVFMSLYNGYKDIREEWDYAPKPRVDFSYPYSISKPMCEKN